MSEVKTLRCEICGKTYLSDEGKNDLLLCTTGENGTAYNDICPRCEENIHNLIEDPNLIKKLKSDNVTMAEGLRKLTDKIRSVWNHVTGLYSVPVHGWLPMKNIDCDVYISKIKDISDEYDLKMSNWQNAMKLYESMKNSRNRWIACVIGILTGNVLAIILNLYILTR